MHRYIEAILAFPLQKADAWRDEAVALRDLAADVGMYASERLILRYRSAPRESGAFEKALTLLVVEAANGVMETRKNVAVAIADEKRLAKQVEQEHANRLEWARRAALAEAAGDASLTREARAREREHAETALTIKAQWTRQAAAVEELKTRLRALDSQVEQAKRDRGRIVVARKMARTHEDLRGTERQMAETIRLLGRLADEMATPVDDDTPPVDSKAP